jgi:hypothetical protein
VFASLQGRLLATEGRFHLTFEQDKGLLEVVPMRRWPAAWRDVHINYAETSIRVCARHSDRHHPRDLYDLHRFSTARLRHNPELLRKFAVLFGSTMDHDLRTYRMDRFKVLNQKELERLLYPLLRADDRPAADKMLKTVSPLLATVLDHNRETSYLEAMASGKYQPELLFPEHADIVERIRKHPALLWKAANVAEHLSKAKKRA